MSIQRLKRVSKLMERPSVGFLFWLLISSQLDYLSMSLYIDLKTTVVLRDKIRHGLRSEGTLRNN